MRERSATNDERSADQQSIVQSLTRKEIIMGKAGGPGDIEELNAVVDELRKQLKLPSLDHKKFVADSLEAKNLERAPAKARASQARSTDHPNK